MRTTRTTPAAWGDRFMERPDSPSSDRALQRLDDLAIIDFAEIAIVAADGEIAFVRDDGDGDIIAPAPDEFYRFRRRDRRRTNDARRVRVPRVRDGALHGRGRRDAVVDDDDVSPVDRHRRRVTANTQFEIARPADLFFEERLHGTAIVLGGIRRDDGLTGR